MTKQLSEENGGGHFSGKVSGVILNVLNKHAAIFKILRCAGCNIINIAVCKLQLLKILQPVLGNLRWLKTVSSPFQDVDLADGSLLPPNHW